MTSCVPSPPALIRSKTDLSEVSLNHLNSPSHQMGTFHDLDLYYIRQLARNCQDQELERRIAVEQRLRDGSTRLLAACSGAESSHPQQRLEAAKTLLASDLRLTAYLEQLQRSAARHDPPAAARTQLTRRQHQGRLCVSELRLPLIWPGPDHFFRGGERSRGRGVDSRRKYAVFCLLRVGSDVFDTTLVNPVDASSTDVCFEDVIVFERVPPSFMVTLEVYSHPLRGEGLGPALAAGTRRLRQSLHSSLSRSAGRRAAAALKENALNATAHGAASPTKFHTEHSGPRFRCIARTTLSVEDVDDEVRCHQLTLTADQSASRGGVGADPGQVGATGATKDLPLFGQVCCRLAAQSNLHMCEAACGALEVWTRESPGWGQHWGSLRGYQLHLWSSEELCQSGDEPAHSVRITKDTTVADATVTADATTYQLQLETPAVKMTLRFPSDDDRDVWRTALEIASADSKLWCRAAEHQMAILSPSARLSAPRPRLRSLYERVSLQEDAPSPDLAPPLPPPSAQLRQRALSTSSSGGLANFIRWGSLRSRRKLLG